MPPPTRVYLFFLVPLFVMVVTGCSGVRTFSGAASGSEALPHLEPRELVALLPSFPAQLASLTAEALVAVSHPEENGRFTARIAFRKDDSLLVRVRFPLGIEGARVLVTPDSAFIFDRIENVVLAGRPEQISQVLPVAVATTDLVHMATGFLTPDPSLEWTVGQDSLLYRLDADNGQWRYLIDPRTWRVVYSEERNGQNDIVEQRWYTDFRSFDGVLLPSRINLSRPMEDTRLSMALQRIDTHPAELDFELGLKEDTRRHVLR